MDKVMKIKMRKTPECGCDRRNWTFRSMYQLKNVSPTILNMAMVVRCPDLFITLATMPSLSLFEYSTSDLNLVVDTKYCFI